MTACWHTQPASYTTWGLDRSGMGEVRRITEDGFVRVTEQSVVRIIERIRTEWTLESAITLPIPPVSWTIVVPIEAFDDGAFDPCAFE